MYFIVLDKGLLLLVLYGKYIGLAMKYSISLHLMLYLLCSTNIGKTRSVRILQWVKQPEGIDDVIITEVGPR